MATLCEDASDQLIDKLTELFPKKIQEDDEIWEKVLPLLNSEFEEFVGMIVATANEKLAEII